MVKNSITRFFLAERKTIKEQFGVDVELQIENHSPLGGEIIAYTTLAFIFGAIASGFFSEIGKDLWTKIKDLCRNILDSRRDELPPPGTIHVSRIMAIFEYGNCQIVAAADPEWWLVVTTGSLGRLELKPGIDAFWDDFVAEAVRIIDSIDKGKNFGLNTKCLHLDYHLQIIYSPTGPLKKAKWTVKPVIERMKIQKAPE